MKQYWMSNKNGSKPIIKRLVMIADDDVESVEQYAKLEPVKSVRAKKTVKKKPNKNK